MKWNEFHINDNVEVINDHYRGGKMLAKKGQKGIVIGWDFGVFYMTKEAWITVKLDGKLRGRNLPARDLMKI